MVSVCKNPIDELGKADTPGICGVHRRGRKKFTWTVIASQPQVRTSSVLRRAGAGLFLARSRIAYGSYAATKAARRSFVRTWTTELKDRTIPANLISPGAVETPIIDGQFPTKEAAEGRGNGSGQSFLSAGLAILKKSPRRRFFWLRMKAATSLATT